jgi:nitrilase
MAELANRAYAYEGQVFVVAACGFLRADDVPDDFALKARTAWEIDGGSAIVGPDGKFLSGPVYGEEAIVTAEIDLDRIIALKANMDAIGNYARPDVFRLQVRRKAWSNVVEQEGATDGDGWQPSEAPVPPAAAPEG